MTEDERHLDLLAIFHFVVGGLTALFACFPLIHVAVGVAILLGKFDEPEGPPQWFGLIFIVVGGMFVLVGWALAIAIIVAGSKLKKRISRTYCIAVAGIECILMPFGTVLGVFTLIVLTRESVRVLFAGDRGTETMQPVA